MMSRCPRGQMTAHEKKRFIGGEVREPGVCPERVAVARTAGIG
jgi:hypothetical protein